MQHEIPSTKLLSLLAEWCVDVDIAVADARIELHSTSTGLSGALVWRVSLSGKMFCLKRWPREYPAPDELASVHGLLQHVAQSGFQIVPAPVITQSRQSFLHSDDHLWELTPWLPGKPYDRNQPSLERRIMAMRCLAQFHLMANSHQAPTVGAAPGLQKRREILRGLHGGDLERFRQAVGAKPASELRTVAKKMLAAIEAYDACRPLSPDERRAIDCFDRGGTLAAAANWLRWLFVEERSISQAEAVQAQLVQLYGRLQAL